MFKISSAIDYLDNLGQFMKTSESQILQMQRKMNKTYFAGCWGTAEKRNKVYKTSGTKVTYIRCRIYIIFSHDLTYIL